MPYKMYMGIKKSVIKKHDKEKEHRQKVIFLKKWIIIEWYLSWDPYKSKVHDENNFEKSWKSERPKEK